VDFRIHRLLFVAIMAFLCLSCTKVPVNQISNPSTSGIKIYGNSYGNFLMSFQPTADGGIMFGGYTLSDSAQTSKGFIQKTDKNGNVKWYKQYGGANWDLFNAVHPTSDGGYIAAGGTTSFGNGLKDYNADCYIVKIDANGTVVWQKTFGGNYVDRFFDVAETPDNGFVAVGFLYNTVSHGNETYVVKVDQNGKTLWSHTYFANDYFSFGASVCVAANGNIGIAAYHVKSDLSSEQYIHYPAFILLNPNGTNLNYPFQIFSNFGYMPDLRTQIPEYENIYNPEKILAVSDGFIFAVNISGTRNSIVLFKVNMQGDTLWSHHFTGLAGCALNDISLNATGGFLISGRTTDASNIHHTLLLCTDANGNEKWESHVPISNYTFWASGVVAVGNIYAMGLNLSPVSTFQPDLFGLLFTDQNGKIIEANK